MTKITEERIRDRAHLIWEREGRPEGREAEHWDRAATELATEASDLPVEALAPGNSGAPGDAEASGDAEAPVAEALGEAVAPKKRAPRAPKAEGEAAPKRAAAKPRGKKAGAEPSD